MKKGFIFVETMVCIAFLSTVLLTVYASFTNVLDNAKVRLMYDDPVYLYRTYYILNFLEENGLTEYINEKFSKQANNTTYITEYGCNSVGAAMSEEITEKSFCEKILQNGDWKVNHIFIMPYNINKVVSCANSTSITDGTDSNCRRNTSLKNLSVQAVNYLYSLDGYTGSSADDEILDRTQNMNNVEANKQIYRMVVEFKVPDKTETYTYYDYCLKSGGTCSDWDPSTYKKTTTITKYKYYYSSLEIPGGSLDIATANGYYIKLKYDGNGGGWCGNSSSKWILQPGTTYAYNRNNGSEYVVYDPTQAINSSGGLADYNNENAICFTKSDSDDPNDLAAKYIAVKGAEWNTKPDGTGVSYDQKDSTVTARQIAADTDCDVTIQPCTSTIYVNWTKNQKYNISFDLNGGSPPSGYTYPTEYWASERYEIQKPTKEHKTFAGWDGTELTAPKMNLVIPKGSIGDRAYTANWNDITHSITYDLNGGTAVATGMPASYIEGVGATVNGKPTRSGNAFNGWSENEDLTSASFSKTISDTATGDKKYYAKWCRNCATVSNGSCSLDATTAGTCTYTTSCNTGYEHSSGKNTYHPVCTIKKYTLTYDTNGGSACTAKTGVSHGSAWGELCTPSKTDAVFVKWVKADGTQVTKNTIAKANLKIYAIWEYKVTFIYQHGVEEWNDHDTDQKYLTKTCSNTASSESCTIVVPRLKNMPCPATDEAISWYVTYSHQCLNKLFVNNQWNTISDGSGTRVNWKDEIKNIKNDKTYYSQYVPNSNYVGKTNVLRVYSKTIGCNDKGNPNAQGRLFTDSTRTTMVTSDHSIEEKAYLVWDGDWEFVSAKDFYGLHFHGRGTACLHPYEDCKDSNGAYPKRWYRSQTLVWGSTCVNLPETLCASGIENCSLSDACIKHNCNN